jgi:hypothetical protein
MKNNKEDFDFMGRGTSSSNVKMCTKSNRNGRAAASKNPSTNYKPVSTHDDVESDSDNDEDGSEHETEFCKTNAQQPEVAVVNPNKTVVSSVSDCVSPASSSSLGSANANSGKKAAKQSDASELKEILPPRQLPQPKQYSSTEEGREQFPDLVRRSVPPPQDLSYGSLPKKASQQQQRADPLQAEGLLAQELANGSRFHQDP